MITASVYLCVQLLSARPLWSISGCSSGIVIVSPSQKIKLYLDNPTHHHPYTTINTLYYVTPPHTRILGITRTQWPIFTRTFQHPVSATFPAPVGQQCTRGPCHGHPHQHLGCSSQGRVSRSAGNPDEHANGESFA